MSADFTTTAQVIADSISPAGNRLTTIEVTLHRFVLAELNTHRVFSRNSASSRAIPVATTMARIADTPVVPLAWPAEQRGMQGGDELPADLATQARAAWLNARDAAVDYAEQLAQIGVHKSVVNRLLEPFATTTVIISATDWHGFWRQRCSPLAQPELRAAAQAMNSAYEASVPRRLTAGQWHLPYIRGAELPELLSRALMVSAARCARVSYRTHDGRRDIDADLNLYDRLIAADPPHASPLEHPATPARPGEPVRGNFTGWHQLRHQVLGA